MQRMANANQFKDHEWRVYIKDENKPVEEVLVRRLEKTGKTPEEMRGVGQIGGREKVVFLIDRLTAKFLWEKYPSACFIQHRKPCITLNQYPWVEWRGGVHRVTEGGRGAFKSGIKKKPQPIPF